jgi:hypothetical protein
MAASPQTAWLTGPALHTELSRPVDGLRPGIPLREAIMTRAETTRVPVLFDRRVDPGRRLDLTLNDAFSARWPRAASWG